MATERDDGILITTRFSYPVLDFRVIDGDTVEVVIDRGWHEMKRVAVRLDGIDCPEKSIPVQAAAAKVATNFTETWMTENTRYDLRLHSHALDKYGRSLGNLVAHERLGKHIDAQLVQYLLQMGVAVRTEDGRRHQWNAFELEAIERLGRAD